MEQIFILENTLCSITLELVLEIDQQDLTTDVEVVLFGNNLAPYDRFPIAITGNSPQHRKIFGTYHRARPFILDAKKVKSTESSDSEKAGTSVLEWKTISYVQLRFQVSRQLRERPRTGEEFVVPDPTTVIGGTDLHAVE